MSNDIVKSKAATSPLSSVVSGVTKSFSALGNMFKRDDHQGSAAVAGAWKVDAVEVNPDSVRFSIHDVSGRPFNIDLPRAELKLVQYVGEQNEPAKELYVQLNKAPADTYIGNANTVLYIGEAKWEDFNPMGRDLERNGIEWVWNTDRGKENRPDHRPKPVFKP